MIAVGYRLAAAFAVALHLAYIVFVLAGGFAAWKWPRLLRLHLPSLAVSAALAITGMECPLTGVEKGLRRLAGDAPYDGGFVSHYIVEPIHAAGTTPPIRTGLRIAVISLTVLAYAGFVTRRRSAAGGATATCR
ncbi:MAG: DUF2784 domain-containing protein [Actinobacteria bacterium]|nr:DUF2784 domain-containing protein [Actinomycetota bacterium]